jgi:hypothetical protein
MILFLLSFPVEEIKGLVNMVEASQTYTSWTYHSLPKHAGRKWITSGKELL